jgi:hypothetical protein
MNILIPIIHGSELRQFFYSGLVKKLRDQGHEIFVTSQHNETIKKELLNLDINFRINDLPSSFNIYSKTLLSYVMYLLDTTCHENTVTWKKKKSKYKSFFKKNCLWVLTKIVKINVFYNFFILLERFLSKRYFSNEWSNYLKNNQIDIVLINVPNVALALNLTAVNLKIPVALFYHTSKDISAINRFIFKVDKIGVWDEEMLQDLKTLGNAKKETLIEAVGNLHHSYLNAPDYLMTKKEFEEMFKCDLNNPVILYTAAAPWVVKNEQEYLNDVILALEKKNIKNFKIIVRTNPMDESNYWDSFKSNTVSINKPKWIWNSKYNFNASCFSDLKLFNSILHYSSVCINIPSSVSIEASLKNLPIINICYSKKEISFLNNVSILDFWNAPFYENIRKLNQIYPAFSKEDLGKKINLLLSNYEFQNKIFFSLPKQNVTVDLCIKLIASNAHIYGISNKMELDRKDIVQTLK